MKKIFALVLCTLLALSCLSFAGAEDVELRCQFWFDSADMAGWQSIIDKFETENPGIKVILESTTWNDYWTKLQTQSTSNAVADVFGMVSMYSKDYIENGVAAGLNQFAEGDDSFIGMDNYYQAIISAYEKDGDYFFLPYDMSTNLLIVNVSMLEECGIEYKEEGWNREEFEEIAATLKEHGYYAAIMNWGGWTFYDILTRAGCNIIDEEGYLDLTGDDVADVLQWYVDMIAKGYIVPKADQTDYMASRLTAMYANNPENAALYVKALPDQKIDVVLKYPTDVEGGKVIAEGGSWGIFSGTQHPEEAWKLLKALTDAYCSINMVAGDFRGIPVVNEESATEAFLNSEFAVEHAQLFLDMLANSTRVDYEGRTAVENEISGYLDLILNGDMGVKEGLAELQEIADGIMGK